MSEFIPLLTVRARAVPSCAAVPPPIPSVSPPLRSTIHSSHHPLPRRSPARARARTFLQVATGVAWLLVTVIKVAVTFSIGMLAYIVLEPQSDEVPMYGFVVAFIVVRHLRNHFVLVLLLC